MKQRVLTAALLIPPVLLAVFIDHIAPVYVLALIAYVLGAIEVNRLTRGSGFWFGTTPFAVLAASPLLVVHYFYNGSPPYMPGNHDALRILAFTSVAMSIVGALAAMYATRGQRGILITEFAAWWLGAGLLALISLHGWSSSGKEIVEWFPGLRGVAEIIPGLYLWASPMLLALIPLWIGDTLAIFAGRAFGKHLLAPKISPKKTVEGGVANLLGCIGGAIGLSYLIHQPLLVGILAGLATGILGQAGDLLESAMKRSAGVKDSGTLLPGHGGLLDRIDSILLSAPVVALVVVTLGSRPS